MKKYSWPGKPPLELKAFAPFIEAHAQSVVEVLLRPKSFWFRPVRNERGERMTSPMVLEVVQRLNILLDQMTKQSERLDSVVARLEEHIDLQRSADKTSP